MAPKMEKERIEIGAVIKWCRAKNGPKVNKAEIFRFFDVQRQTGNSWFPGNGSSDTQQTPQSGKKGGKHTLTNSEHQHESPKRKNPVRNDGRDQKRLKSMMEDMERDIKDYGSPSPPSTASSADSSPSFPAGEPVTPPRNKISKAFEKNSEQDGHQDEKVEVDIKDEEYDDEDEV